MSVSTERILSVQSHVAFGYVGGKAATFPLQCLGYDVDGVNTVNFSNHAGYGRSGGSRTAADELTSIFDAMDQNELLCPTRLLTGYIPGAAALSAVAELAKKLISRSPNLIYLLDPVMGDAGRLYVAPDVIPVYREILPLSTVITPNWFEVETLTDIRLIDVPSLQRALIKLHEYYKVPNVVISSIPLMPWLLDALPSNIKPIHSEQDYLLCLSSSYTACHLEETSILHAHCVPCIPGYFSGVGDLFSALLLGHLNISTSTTSTPLAYAASQALTKTHAMLVLTNKHASALPEEDRQMTDEEKDKTEPLRRTRRMRGRELRLVQGQDIIRGIGIKDERIMQPWTGFWLL